MYNFEQMTFHIGIGFRHAHLCTNDYLHENFITHRKVLQEW